MTARESIRIRDFGCVICQAYHREGEPLYEAHLMYKSKHGIREYLMPIDLDLRLALERASRTHRPTR